MKSTKKNFGKKLYNKYLFCAVLVLVVAIIIAASLIFVFKHSHSYGEWETFKQASCSSYGIEIRFCECGEIQEKKVDKLDHTESDWQFDLEHNLKKTVCLICGITIKSESFADHKHTWSAWEVDIEPTCTEKGSTTRKCDCGANESMTLPATEHDFKDWIITKNPSCGVEGSKERSCNNCDTIESQKLPALSHSEGDWFIVGNEKLFPCVYCGTVLRIETIEKATDLDISNGVVLGIGECKDTDIDIPSIHKGINVIQIGEKAFYKNTKITSVIMPNTIKIIGDQAFWGCQSIQEIVLPESVEIIGERAFAYCTKLQSISLSTSLKEINMWAFEYCTSLKTINFNGTIAQWNAINKGEDWDLGLKNYTINCIDGIIEK